MTIAEAQTDIKSGAWFEGVSVALTAMQGEKYRLSETDIRRNIGIFVCADGLCEGICSHSYDVISEKYALPYDKEYDFVDGVAFVLGNLRSFLGGNHE